LLPILLAVGGKHAFHIPLRPSMSDYYWASTNFITPPCEKPKMDYPAGAVPILVDIPGGSMRSYFVGFLFAIGAMLFCYKGYTSEENWALNFAGAMAWGVALFLAIAYVSFFRAKDTLHFLGSKWQKTFYRYTYNGLAVMMVVAPAIAWYKDVHDDNQTAIFWVELWGIYTFAMYWVVKLTEVHKVGERRAIEEHEKHGPLTNA
jgi:hypothetical protein